MLKLNRRYNSLEPLEARIAPAAASAYPLLPSEQSHFVAAHFGAPILVKTGQILSTTGQAGSGSYLLYVEKGEALVFFTDLNNNNQVDFNEMTGIAAGDGLRVTLFTDLHGDMVTNEKDVPLSIPGANGSTITQFVPKLTDSDNNPSNDPSSVGGDGRVLLDTTIERVTLRALQPNEFSNPADASLRQPVTTFSIYGNIYAGHGFGTADGLNGLIIDKTNLLVDATGAPLELNFGLSSQTNPYIGSIKVGTAASGEFFSFGASVLRDINGTFTTFAPAPGEAGGSINGVKMVNATGSPAMNAVGAFSIDTLHAGNGGLGGAGGDIKNVLLNGVSTGGYKIIAGDGGDGASGGKGGSISNFADFGSTTNHIVIQSGNGGSGSTGTGGDGGTFDFQVINIKADLGIKLGDGGDGFTGGGKGASLLSGNFTQPAIPNYLGAGGVGSVHQAVTVTLDSNDELVYTYSAEIGMHQVLDLNEDGFGDFVYTTKGTTEIVVLLSTSSNGFYTGIERININGPSNPTALAVADLNNDSHLDIVVASNDLGAQGGLYVYLAQWEHYGPGAPTPGEDLFQDGINHFLRFNDARISVLPSLNNLFISNGVQVTSLISSPVQVSSIVAGDFTGPNSTDSVTHRPQLALIATYYGNGPSSNGVITALEDPHQVLMYLNGDLETDHITGKQIYTGQFYADFGTKGDQSANQPADLHNPLRDIGEGTANSVTIEASALSTTSSSFDSIIVAAKGAGNKDATKGGISVYNYAARANGVRPVLMGYFGTGVVDSNRDIGDGKQTEVVFQTSTFTVVDFDNDGNADVAAISTAPVGFLVGSKGNGFGTGVQISGGDGVAPMVENAGNFLGTPGLGLSTDLLRIKSADFNGDGKVDELAVLYNGGVALITMNEGLQPATLLNKFEDKNIGAADSYFFDLYYPSGKVSEPNLVTNAPADTNSLFSILPLPLDYFDEPIGFLATPLFLSGTSIHSGDGGNSTIGNGGNAGSLGGGFSLVKGVDAITGLNVKTLQGSLTFTYAGDVVLETGHGGNGFYNGGAGGAIKGVNIVYSGDGTGLGDVLITGHGGRGVNGTGGSGGAISGVSLDTSLTRKGFAGGALSEDTVTLVTGYGGSGNIGGTGGSVTGNGSGGSPDVQASSLSIETGAGGNGVKAGGNAGNIAKFSPIIRVPPGLTGPGDGFGDLVYTAGNGGKAISGPGGKGGSITDSAPQPSAFLSSYVEIFAGNGGSGTVGGAGGSVSNFVLTLTGGSPSPTYVAVEAGHGGTGFFGKGGVGGSITKVQFPTRGNASGYTNLFLAGNGGASASSAGADGGSITDIFSVANNAAFAVVAGAGGDGLTQGGKGGSVITGTLSLDASTKAKVLIISGAGGSASAFIPNLNDSPADQVAESLNQFGGLIGKGGNGGDIIGFTQTGITGMHADLIAGNGGSTLNYGSVFDSPKKVYVGKGGSIKSINMQGDIGNIALDNPATADINENIPIKSYNNTAKGESVAQYVESILRYGLPVLTDADGNVGIVVGAAGRGKAVALNSATPHVYTSIAANGSTNGDLISVGASHIMSAVAGSVDKIAAIHVARYIVTSDGNAGTDKGTYFTALQPVQGVVNRLDYIDVDGMLRPQPASPVLDGALIDGAFVYSNTSLPASQQVVGLNGRVYRL